MANERKRKSEALLHSEKFLCIENAPKTANINEMCTELLEMIFEHLPLHERIICKEVCIRWYLILMESPLFHKDRHVYFRNCIINAIDEEPMSTIFNAAIPYERFTFNAIVNNCELDTQKTAELLRATKEINFVFKEGDTILLKILLEAPLLEKLSFNIRYNFSIVDFIQNKATKINLKTFVRENPNIELKNIKTVNITADSEEPDLYSDEFLDPLRKLIPEQAIINVHINNRRPPDIRDDVDLYRWISLMSTKQTKFSMNVVCPCFEQMSEELIESFAALDVTYNAFYLTYKYKEHHAYDLDKVLEKIKTNDIILYLDALPPIPNNFHRITAVILDRGDTVNFKWLENMENLRELELLDNFDTRTCVFGHEAIKLDKLEKIKFCRKLECQECFNAFKQSFENLKEIDIKAESSFLLEIKCWKKLNKLVLSLEDLEVIEENNIQQFPLHSLRELRIINTLNPRFTNKKITACIKQMFPNLEKLVYNGLKY